MSILHMLREYWFENELEKTNGFSCLRASDIHSTPKEPR